MFVLIKNNVWAYQRTNVHKRNKDKWTQTLFIFSKTQIRSPDTSALCSLLMLIWLGQSCLLVPGASVQSENCKLTPTMMIFSEVLTSSCFQMGNSMDSPWVFAPNTCGPSWTTSCRIHYRASGKSPLNGTTSRGDLLTHFEVVFLRVPLHNRKNKDAYPCEQNLISIYKAIPRCLLSVVIDSFMTSGLWPLTVVFDLLLPSLCQGFSITVLRLNSHSIATLFCTSYKIFALGEIWVYSKSL